MHLREESQTKQALGGNVTIGLVVDTPIYETMVLFNQLWKQVYEFERQFSRFIPDSELSRFNRKAGSKQNISIEFEQLLTRAKQLGQQTEGLYNPFIFPALQKAGYNKSASPGYEKDIQEDYSDLRVENIEKLNIEKGWAEIPYGTAIDIGGCGKGYLADQLGIYLEGKDVKGYWLSIGGDILVKGKDANGELISVAIQDSNNTDITSDWIMVAPVEGMAVATSGTYLRRKQLSDKKWHHIIDPLTLEPAITDVRLATVVTMSATKADVLASCVVILGSKKSEQFLKNHDVESALLQCIDKNGKYFELHFGDSIIRVNNHK